MGEYLDGWAGMMTKRIPTPIEAHGSKRYKIIFLNNIT